MVKTIHAYRETGLTLIEVMVAITIVGILGVIGIPSFLNTIDRARVTGAADNLITNIRLVQSEATKSNQTATITFSTGSNWSYTSNTSPAITVSNSDYRGTTLSTGAELTAAANVLTFDPRRNMITPRPADGLPAITLLTIQSARGQSMSITVSSNSDIALCSSSSLGGYPAC